jgi:hypothetical protein
MRSVPGGISVTWSGRERWEKSAIHIEEMRNIKKSKAIPVTGHEYP